MAKQESRLRQRIKQALEADGWSVITQYGSAYSPNVLDLTVVVACLEVKTDTGSIRPGQRNTIRKLRKAGIPAGIVRSVDEARLGMQQVKQGVYRVADNNEIDMSFLNSLLAGAAVAEPEHPDAAAIDVLADNIPAATLTELMGMVGTYEEFTPAPADPEPEPAVSVHQQRTDHGDQTIAQYNANYVRDPSRDNLDQLAQAREIQAREIAGVSALLSGVTPVPSGGLLERIAGHIQHIDELLSSFISGFQEPVPAAAEKPARQTRRGRPPKTEATPAEATDPDDGLPL